MYCVFSYPLKDVKSISQASAVYTYAQYNISLQHCGMDLLSLFFFDTFLASGMPNNF